MIDLTRIPQAAPGLRFARYRQSVKEAIDRVLDGSSFILGPQLEAFEQAFASFIGVKHCVGVNSGTDAISLALRALGIGPGDEVITSALTAAGTAHGILQTGASLRFSDIDPQTRCLDPRAVAASITTRTAAIVPVHLHGYPADIVEFAAIADRHGLVIMEDCAQAHGTYVQGRKAGTFGAAAAFSFYPTKNLGAVGDGGAVITNDDSVAARLRSLRCYGWTGQDRISSELAFNSRLDELQASILLSLLAHLEAGNDERRTIARQYREGLANTKAKLPPHSEGCVYHQFAIACDNRDELARFLREECAIDTALHYWPPLHHQPAFANIGIADLPITDMISAQILSLPIQPEVAQGRTERIIAALVKGLSFE